jgi:hypothetical protein
LSLFRDWNLGFRDLNEMSNPINKIKISKKRLPIIMGVSLGIIVAVFLIGLAFNSFSGGSAIKVVSAQNVYQSAENPQFVFIYKNESNIFNKILTAISNLFSSENKKVTASVKIFDTNDKEIDNLNPQIKESGGKFTVDLDHSHFQQELRPGQYEVEMEIIDGKKTHTQSQSFYWGVLAINTNKSIYSVGEEAYLQLASLDKEGHTLCNSKLELQIQNPKSKIQKLSTEDGTIKLSGKCSGDNVTDIPDYFAYYNVSEPGRYEMKLINLDNGFEITDYFSAVGGSASGGEILDSVPFDVERTGPTRIWPYAPYAIKIKIIANQDFEGEIIETVPMTFGISNAAGADIQTIDDNYIKLISWKTSIKKGETKELSYSIDFPHVSPYFYLIGPLQLKSKCQNPNCSKSNSNDQSSNYSEIIFEESRQWQIAADAETEIFITTSTAPNGYSCGANCFTTPVDWNSASNSVEVIAAGGTAGDGATGAGAGGGGGGGYSKGVNLDISGDITFGVGASGSQPSSTAAGGAGGNTWFNATSLANCETVGSASGGGNGCVGAEGGKGGQGSGGTRAGGSGGLAANGVGNTARYSGGTGGAGSGNDGNGGGGGAAGPLIATDGDGHTGGNGSSVEGGGGGGAGGASATDGSASGSPNAGEGGNGGTGYSGAAGGDGGATPAAGAIGTTPGAGGGGGDQTTTTSGTNGGNGAIGQQFSSTAGSGGGGGGAGDSGTRGGTGGNYGGGGGGGASCTTEGNCLGARGIIYIDYTPLSFTVSGTCKQYDQSANSTEAATVKVAVNTSVNGTTASCSTGSWSVTLSAYPVKDDVITVWVDNVNDPNEAVAVTRYDGSGQTISGVNLYENHLVIGSDDNTFASTSDLAVYDNSVSTDEDIFFDASATSLEVCRVSGCETSELYIVAGNKYSVGSSSATFVEVHDIEIDGTFNLTGAGNYASISGSWNNDSVFTPNSSTIFFVASDSAEIVSASAGTTNSFYNLQFGDSATTSYTGQWTLNGNETTFDVNNNLTIDAGTVVNSGTKNVTLAGNLSLAVNGNYTKGSGTFTFDGTSKTWTDNRAAPADMGAVVIDGGGTISLGSSVKATSLNITSGDTLNLNSSGYTLTIAGSGQTTSRPLIDAGTLDCGSNSTVEFTGTSAVDIDTTGYYNLTLNGTGTYYSYGDTVASGSLSVAVGTFDGQNDTWTLYKTGTGVFSVAGTFTPSTSTINYVGNGATTIASMSDGGNTGYYNLWVGYSTTQTGNRTYTLDGNVTSVYAMVGASSGSYYQTLALSSYTLTITGTGLCFLPFDETLARLDAGTGTVSFVGNGATTVPGNAYLNYWQYYNLSIGTSNNANITYTLAAANAYVTNQLSLQSAGSGYTNTFDLSTYNLTVGLSSVVDSGSISVPVRSKIIQTSGTVTVQSSDNATTPIIGGAGEIQFYSLAIGSATDNLTYTFTLAGEIGASGSFSLPTGGASDTHYFDVSASNYGLSVYGNFTVGTNASTSFRSGTVTLGGTADTTYTNSGSTEFYNLTMNKTGTDANDDLNLASNLVVRNTLTITDGQLLQGNYDVRAEGSSAVSIASGTDKEWTNIGTGDLVLGGTFANAGSVAFDTSDSGCTDIADAILITSTVTGTRRIWSGAGTFDMHNLDVLDQGASGISITAYDSTYRGNGANWLFTTCSSTSGTTGPLRIKGGTRIKGGARAK